MENIIKTMGEINERIYGINPFTKFDEEKEKLSIERSVDLEELKKDEFYER